MKLSVKTKEFSGNASIGKIVEAMTKTVDESLREQLIKSVNHKVKEDLIEAITDKFSVVCSKINSAKGFRKIQIITATY